MPVKRIAMFIVVAILSVLFSASSCEGDAPESDGLKKENKSRKANYDKIVEKQPAHSMDYSPTRETKNFWIDTWGKKGKTSYVYLFTNTGTVVGYYVLDGLPVNYCTSLVPPVQKVNVDMGEYNGETYIPAPSIDGTYSSGGDCMTFYGKDASNGAFIQYTAGQGLNPLLYDQPLSPDIVLDAPNLGKVKR